MLRPFLLALLALAAAPASAQVYVDASATGANTGASWADAYTDLALALSQTGADPRVLVAEGRYTPHPTDRDASFRVPAGITVVGGYPPGGGERDPARWRTVLSGDLAGDDGPDFAGTAENSRHVVTWSAASPYAGGGLDGLTVSGGNADGSGDDGMGGGLFVERTGAVQGAPFVLSGVTFARNQADAGGAVYARDLGGDRLAFTDVRFEGNRAEGRGGAVHLRAASPTFERVTFEGNRARDGGGLFLHVYWSGRAAPTLTDVSFTDNAATSSGGAISMSPYGSGSVGGLYTRVTFTGNTALVGGAVDLDNNESADMDPVFRDCTFERNAALDTNGYTSRGGAVYFYSDQGADTTPIFERCRFLANTATNGGALYFSTDDSGRLPALFVRSTFAGNVAGSAGGAAFLAANDGGDTNPAFVDAVFSGNRAEVVGGTLALETFDGRIALAVASSTLASNAAPTAGAIWVEPSGSSRSRVTVQNSVLWDNGSDAVQTASAPTTLDHVLAEGGCPASASCASVIDADPRLSDPDGPDRLLGTLDDDLSLLPDSPALDAGDADLLPSDAADLDRDGDTDEPLPLDRIGSPRTVGAETDLGAFERGGAPVAEIAPTSPVIVGPSGGEVGYTVSTTNTLDASITVEVWVERVAPDGTVTLVSEPETVTLGPGESTGPLAAALAVPAGAAVGAHTVRQRVGTFPDGVLAQDAFEVEVSALAQLTVAVTTDEDEYDGLFGSPNEGCSLREAIETVNRGESFGGCTAEGVGSPALITVPAGFYLLERDGLTSPDIAVFDLDLTAPARIVGAGSQTTFVSAAAYDDDQRTRVLEITGTGAMPVEIVGVTFRDGEAGGPGGAVSAVGTDLVLRDVGLANSAGGDGGGLYHTGGDLTMIGVAVVGNEGASGGGVYHTGGDVLVQDSRIADNTTRRGAPVFDDERARDGGRGGGLYVASAGTVIIEDTEVSGNTTGAGGGVGDDDGTAGTGGAGAGVFARSVGAVTVVGSVFEGNVTGNGGGANDGATGRGGPGGGLIVREAPSLTVRQSRFVGNETGRGGVAAKSDVDSAGGRGGTGGGLYARDVGAVELVEVEVVGNAAGRGGDGYDNTAGPGGSAGGVFLRDAAVRIERSLIAENRAGDGGELHTSNSSSQGSGSGGTDGGLLAVSVAALDVEDVTVSGNRAGEPGATVARRGDPGSGGGLTTTAALSLRNVTITANSVPAGGTGAGLTTLGASGTRTFANSVVAGNTAGDVAADCQTEGLSDAGFNVVGAGCPVTAPSTVAVAPEAVFSVVLSPDLADNGGPTRTHALLDTPANPALDIGGTCAPTDQRGAAAPTDGDGDGSAECDAGAFEAGGQLGATTREEGPGALDLAVFPNPTAGPSTVRVELPSAGAVRVVVLDALGREVARLADGPLAAGVHALGLDVRLPAGVYLVRATVGADVAVRPLSVVR